ncbi:2-oxo-4-hydroxy-4-carboxy-5-ureidoimidazoline decarboxylase [Psychromonas aquatilis]|uniref:2-oxo-4-hydroxy-4-carboxy-5-ureidoimidazoline decarboxylase n=1 Tax=Psychromonas aquatilis TaxID=2005072 RepID=A0ABU9GLP3_9GAMM
MSLDKLNKATVEQAYEIFETCCCAPNWVEQMIAARPFTEASQLLETSEKCFAQLNQQDYLAAFLGHPQIGDLNTLHEKYANTSGTASNEQAGMSEADSAVLQEMVQLNRAYFEKFGFIFIVCASGKSAEEMLQLIKQRMPNSFEDEMQIAGNEQAKITTIRLEKLL